ncbi:hypothetical protein [Deinococcus budaensis]|uniref:GNAT superfamily N-acetyltransferase n=1 Tax=Deinococcus budaensis TaxID=1665626 RepID=A0A7W8LNH6_9DEIO|nr:hypothetical protein [Deinococcus budaensis]MBB5232731.1 GNAT superfamily N-acetyltransferase [Deinococcus budaensis]
MPDPLPTAADLAAFSLAAQHPLTRTWVDDRTRLALLAEEHAFDLQLATDLDLAAQRADFLNVGQPPAAFLNRWAEVGPDLGAMLSIRFEGLDREKPFVDASVTTRPLTPDDLPALQQAALDVYGAFQPGRLRVWSAAPLEGWTAALPGASADLRVLAAPLAALRRRGVPDGLTLRPARDLTHHGEAVAAYAAVDARHPQHAGQARVIEEDDLRACIEAGTMFDVLWRGSWSGYAGTLPETQLGLPAQVVQELLLAPHARGHGLGPPLSTLLARALPGDERVLSGTIHGENLGARRAARNAGRHDVGGWSWVPLAEA